MAKQTNFNVSGAQALNSNLLLAQLLIPLLNPPASPPKPKNRVVARREASGKHVGGRKEAQKFVREKNEQRRQNLPTLDQTEIRKFIEEQKLSNPDKPVDFSKYAGYKLVGSPFQINIPGTDSYLGELKDVVDDLKVNNTNFFENINVDGVYFRRGNFSGCKFKDTIGVTFDGCDLTNADMSGTTQKEMLLGGYYHFNGFASYLIDEVRTSTKNQDEISDDNKRLISQIYGLETMDTENEPTKFVNVNLKGATLNKIDSTYLTNYNGTSFKDVVLEDIVSFLGKNVQLQGAILKTSDGQTKNITNPITAEKIAEDATPFVSAMLQNNVLKKADGEKTIIALSKDCLGKAKEHMINKGVMNSNQSASFSNVLDPTKEELDKILSIFKKQFNKHNVKFVIHKEEDTNYDFFINFCHVPKNDFGAYADGRLGWTNQSIIIYDNQTTPSIYLHELGHTLGAEHPFGVGIKETGCSLFASVMCYDSALDIMVPLDALSKYPARISPDKLENFGIQDKSHYNLIFGRNPDYKEQDITTNLIHNQIRIIDGDKNFQNIAHINTTSLPKDIKYAVLDAKEAIGTCFKFPCDTKNIAEGIDEGTLVVFYTKDKSGGDEISGVALLHGGMTNKIFIDGKEVVPTRGLTAEAKTTPTLPPSTQPQTQTPTQTPRPTHPPQPISEPTTTPLEINSNSNNNLIGPLAGAGAAVLMILAVLSALKKKCRKNNIQDNTSTTQVSDDLVFAPQQPGASPQQTGASRQVASPGPSNRI